MDDSIINDLVAQYLRKDCCNEFTNRLVLEPSSNGSRGTEGDVCGKLTVVTGTTGHRSRRLTPKDRVSTGYMP